jgi:hypothetical protein
MHCYIFIQEYTYKGYLKSSSVINITNELLMVNIPHTLRIFHFFKKDCIQRFSYIFIQLFEILIRSTFNLANN